MTPAQTEAEILRDRLDRIAARLDSVLILTLMSTALAAVTLVLVAAG
jgi:hypothetical protein